MAEALKDAPATKSRRVTIDLTPAAVKELDRLRSITGLTTADVFRHAFSLFRLYVDAKRQNKEFEVVSANPDEPNTRIELPLSIDRSEYR